MALNDKGRELRTAWLLRGRRAVAALYGGTRLDVELKAAFNNFFFPALVVALAGKSVATTRLVASGIYLASSSTPAKSSARLPSALLASRVALTGRSSTHPRAVASLGFASLTATLAGQVRSTVRAQATLRTRVPLTGTTRSIARVTATLRSQLAVSGAVRIIQRVTAHIQFAGTTAALTGLARTSVRTLSVGLYLVHKATPARIHGRMRCAALTFGTPPLALTGTLRAHARHTANRLGMAYSVGPSFATARVKSAVLASACALVGKLRVVSRMTATLGFASSNLALAGTWRTIERMRGATLSSKLAINGSAKASAKVHAAFLGTKQACTGSVCHAARLVAALLTSRTAVAGRVVAGARVRGQLQFAGGTVAQVAGTLRVVARAAGASMVFKPVLRGTIRSGSVARGALLAGKVSCGGSARASARIAATLRSAVALRGFTRVAYVGKASLVLKVAVLGTARGAIRLRSAIVTSRVTMAGFTRAVSRSRGGQLMSRVVVLGTCRGYARTKAALGFQPVPQPVAGLLRTHPVAFGPVAFAAALLPVRGIGVTSTKRGIGVTTTKRTATFTTVKRSIRLRS